MAQENRISFKVPQETIAEIEAAINVLLEKLLPHLVILSSDDRSSLIKMGDKNVAFIERCKEFMEQNPELSPKYLDIEEMNIDMKAVEVLRQLHNPIQHLASAIDDSIMLSGSEAYGAALAFYHHIKGAARMKIAGAKNMFDVLKKQFNRKSKKADDKSTNTENNNT